MRWLIIVGVAALLAAPAAQADVVLFQENFENPLGLSDGNWARIGSAVRTADPQNASNHVVTFTSDGSGGDLFSIFINYPTALPLRFSFDFLQTDLGGYAYAGIDHQNANPCGCAPGSEQWLWSTQGNEPYSTNPAAGVWAHVSFDFTPTNNTSPLVVKFESSASYYSPKYFDNIELDSVPEPTALPVAIGGCLLILLIARRSAICR